MVMAAETPRRAGPVANVFVHHDVCGAMSGKPWVSTKSSFVCASTGARICLERTMCTARRLPQEMTCSVEILWKITRWMGGRRRVANERRQPNNGT